MNIHTARGIVLNDSRKPATPGLFERVRTYLAHEATRRQLRQLDDRMLRDIGITRGDIEIRRLLK